MVNPDDELSVRQQCRLLDVSRSSHYYKPVDASDETLLLMRRIDELHLKRPSLGSRAIAKLLSTTDRRVNRKRIQRLMNLMDIESLAPKPKTSLPDIENAAYPYLLRHLTIEQPNHVWATDITYIPMEHGFAYLVAIMDWCSRRVLSWRLSNTMDTRFCVGAVKEALAKFGCPTILNSDQGAQFTSQQFTEVLHDSGIQISMDGRGRWIDNVFIERVWRSLKYEEVYLHAYRDLDEARVGIGAYFDFYNNERPHQSLGYATPAAFYDALPLKVA
mgnify:CR=1 FL=1|jgi:putative transposase|tara:strand:- start:186 stop:1007 length:822 start_codon:yes stop_codon:yes gene_type:complete